MKKKIITVASALLTIVGFSSVYAYTNFQKSPDPILGEESTTETISPTQEPTITTTQSSYNPPLILTDMPSPTRKDTIRLQAELVELQKKREEIIEKYNKQVGDLKLESAQELFSLKHELINDIGETRLRKAGDGKTQEKIEAEIARIENNFNSQVAVAEEKLQEEIDNLTEQKNAEVSILDEKITEIEKQIR